MSTRMAVVGKGGAGKSVVAGTLARLLARRGRDVLTLDSDLMPGLALSLGLGAFSAASLAGAVERDERGRWRLRKGIGPVRAVEEFSVVAPDGVRHLQGGKLAGDGLEDIMGSVNGLHQVIHGVAKARRFAKWTILGDLPAGTRQLANEWAPYADTFVLVVEPTWKSVLTASRIARIIRSRPGATVVPVANKVDGPGDVERIEAMMQEKVAGAVPLDEAVREAERRGVALVDHRPDAPTVDALVTLIDRLCDAEEVSGR